MAAFATVAAAEVRLAAKGPAGDKTWVNGHIQRGQTGTIGIRVIRYMGPGASLVNGGWVEITDDAVV